MFCTPIERLQGRYECKPGGTASGRHCRGPPIYNLPNMLPSSHTAKMAHSHNMHNDHAPDFERTSLGTLDDARPAPGGQGPFMMSTLVPDQFPAPPANVQLTRTSITGVDDGDSDSGLEKGDDLEKGQVRSAVDPRARRYLPLVITAAEDRFQPFPGPVRGTTAMICSQQGIFAIPARSFWRRSKC